MGIIIHPFPFTFFYLKLKKVSYGKLSREPVLLTVVEDGANTLSRSRDLYRILHLLLFPPNGNPTGGSKALNEHRVRIVAPVLGRRRRSNRRATGSNRRGTSSNRRPITDDIDHRTSGNHRRGGGGGGATTAVGGGGGGGATTEVPHWGLAASLEGS